MSYLAASYPPIIARQIYTKDGGGPCKSWPPPHTEMKMHSTREGDAKRESEHVATDTKMRTLKGPITPTAGVKNVDVPITRHARMVICVGNDHPARRRSVYEEPCSCGQRCLEEIAQPFWKHEGKYSLGGATTDKIYHAGREEENARLAAPHLHAGRRHGRTEKWTLGGATRENVR